MRRRGTTRTKHGSLAEIIAANFYSDFLIPLSSRYSTEEWNAAMKQAIAIRAGQKDNRPRRKERS